MCMYFPTWLMNSLSIGSTSSVGQGKKGARAPAVTPVVVDWPCFATPQALDHSLSILYAQWSEIDKLTICIPDPLPKRPMSRDDTRRWVFAPSQPPPPVVWQDKQVHLTVVRQHIYDVLTEKTTEQTSNGDIDDEKDNRIDPSFHGEQAFDPSFHGEQAFDPSFHGEQAFDNDNHGNQDDYIHQAFHGEQMHYGGDFTQDDYFHRAFYEAQTFYHDNNDNNENQGDQIHVDVHGEQTSYRGNNDKQDNQIHEAFHGEQTFCQGNNDNDKKGKKGKKATKCQKGNNVNKGRKGNKDSKDDKDEKDDQTHQDCLDGCIHVSDSKCKKVVNGFWAKLSVAIRAEEGTRQDVRLVKLPEVSVMHVSELAQRPEQEEDTPRSSMT
ncbi:uncharacterized protein PG986_006827 [Apiospora aurea]|uniref:Uncharacterized protein n=1 Tax=Apiospora aurea TaxID=335848 RepID=A0ABR1QAV5_9PEZI